MITKERLEELIALNKPFWYVYDSNILKTINAKYWRIADNKICWYADSSLYRSFENLFETKEEAEWYLEFGNIQRTETLSLPPWEEAKQYFDTDKEFILIGNKYFLGILNNPKSIVVIDKTLNRFIFNPNKFDKDTYIEACELCKKLFLGDEE